MRKTKDVAVPMQGRDYGKIFRLTEMTADKGEKWAIRALLAFAAGGMDIPVGIVGQGMAGVGRLLVAGIYSFPGLKFADIDPLLDEMLGCVQVIRDKQHPDLVLPFLQDDTEEIATRLWLRMEIIELHVGFSLAGALQALGSQTTTAQN